MRSQPIGRNLISKEEGEKYNMTGVMLRTTILLEYSPNLNHMVTNRKKVVGKLQILCIKKQSGRKMFNSYPMIW